MLFLNIIYVLLAIGMIALILMQRGSGAQAGAGFGGGGASGTVFGSRGSSSFLTKATKWMAITFFAISLGMAWYAQKGVTAPAEAGGSLMSEVPVAPAVPADASVPVAPVQPAAGGAVPAAPAAMPVAPVEQPAAAPATPGSSTGG